MKYLKHFFIVSVLVAIVTVGVSYLLDNLPLLPMSASTQAGPIDELFSMHFRVISFLFALIVVFMLYSLVVFRRRDGDQSEGDHFEGNTGLEIVWTVIPLIIVIYFAYIGAQSLDEIRRIDPDALEVNVTAFQWSWSFEYPDYGVTSSTLYLPKDQQALLKMTSLDVIHSFWVPEMRLKQDALPGEDYVRELRLTPTKLGDYTVRCAELCGGAHAYMNSPVVVMEQADFDAWVVEQQQGATQTGDLVTRGENLATEKGCISCHSVDGTAMVGPTWKGLSGRETMLADGSTITADTEYLRNAIVNPNAEVVQGFQPVMPSYDGVLTDEEIDAIIAYIESLK